MGTLKSLSNSVIPTHVGIQVACSVDSRLRGNDAGFRLVCNPVLDSSDIACIMEWLF